MGRAYNLAADSIPDRDVGSYTAGHRAAGSLGLTKQLLSFETALGIAVAGGSRYC